MTACVWCDKDELTIASTIKPITVVLKPEPGDTVAQKEEKHKKPYCNKKRVVFAVNYLGSEYTIAIKRGYRWDGATCLGLHHLPFLLNASMVHDALCENHELVKQDRQLSSMIFREIGIASGGWKWFMYGAYYVIDTFQKYYGIDRYGKGWKR